MSAEGVGATAEGAKWGSSLLLAFNPIAAIVGWIFFEQAAKQISGGGAGGMTPPGKG